VDDVLSSNFLATRARDRLFAVGGDRLCVACAWSAKTLALRCACFFARVADERGTGGIWFVPFRPIPRPADWPSSKPWLHRKPDTMIALLHPPPPPFVACLPKYGLDHGGESAGHRALLGALPAGTPRPPDLLERLQAKATAPFAEISYSATRYHLQIDDGDGVIIDVPLWRRLRGAVLPAVVAGRAIGMGVTEIRDALTRARCPSTRAPKWLAPTEAAAAVQKFRAAWAVCEREIRDHTTAPWWDLFVELVPIPDLPPKLEAAPVPAVDPSPAVPVPPPPKKAPSVPRAKAPKPIALSLFPDVFAKETLP
jgi:hypothetical protein